MTPVTGIIIQARTGSGRLPGKILLPFHGNQSILEILITRLKTNKPALPVIVATTSGEEDNPVQELARKLGVACYRGETNDVLSRFINAARSNNLKTIVRVCADNPFFSAEFLESLLDSYDGVSDYCSYRMSNNLPAIRSHIGLFGEICTTGALEKARELTDSPLYLEHVTSFLYSHPDIFSLQLINAPRPVFSRSDIRLTVDTAEDFNMLRELYSSMVTLDGVDDLENLVGLIDRHPEWKEQMKAQILLNAKV